MKCTGLEMRTLLLALLTTLLGACATIGQPFDYKGPSTIVIGKTTKQEILATFGNPFRTGYEDDKLKWTYGYYHYRVFGDSDTKDLSVTFDKDGRVSTYTYSSSDPDEIKKSVEK